MPGNKKNPNLMAAMNAADGRGAPADPRFYPEADHPGPEPSGVTITGTSPRAMVAAKAPDLSDHLPPASEREPFLTFKGGHR
jgi:hypothetical protein